MLTWHLLNCGNGWDWAQALFQAPANGKRLTATGNWATSVRSHVGSTQATMYLVLPKSVNLRSIGTDIEAFGIGLRPSRRSHGRMQRKSVSATGVTWPAFTHRRSIISFWVRRFIINCICSLKLKVMLSFLETDAQRTKPSGWLG